MSSNTSVPKMSTKAATPRKPASSLDVFKPDLFNGKVLFCTGGGSGICKEMTAAMMRHGANAVIIGRNLDRITKSAQELSSSTGRKCIAAQADVRQPEQLKAAAAKAIETFGRIDFVICGAAGNFLSPIEGLSENAFKTVIEIDALGTFHTIKATLPYVRETQGAYIHVSATLHYRGTYFQAHASAAKAAVDALSAVLAVEEGPRGVRSNVIAPGPIGNTAGMDHLGPKVAIPGLVGDGSNRYPLQRNGTVEDIANATVFMFSEAACLITGQVLVVDGGADHTETVTSFLPYPQAVLDPASMQKMIKGKL